MVTKITLSDGAGLNCKVSDFLRPWDDSTPVVMVHGFARNARFWDEWVPILASRHRVYRLEVRGCGGSDVPPLDYEFDGAQLVKDLLEALDGLELDRVHWVGEYSGSLLGLLIALDHPDRIAGMTLCGAPTQVPKQIHGGVYPIGEKSTAAALRRYGVAEWSRRTIDYRLDTARADPRLVNWFIEQMGRTPVHVAAGLTDCFGALSIRDRIHGAAQPALLITGGSSDWILEQQRATAATMPNARLKVIDGYGHGIYVLRPRECAEAALAFWDRLDSSA
jgi:pimeloyl-ACP methyl ester carboxylesterase